MVAVTPAGERRRGSSPVSTSIRYIGPEADAGRLPSSCWPPASAREYRLQPQPPEPIVTALTSAMGGRVEDGYVSMAAETTRSGGRCRSTIVAAGVAAALDGATPAALGIETCADRSAIGSGVAVFAVGRRRGTRTRRSGD